jgi:hypothetical protein
VFDLEFLILDLESVSESDCLRNRIINEVDSIPRAAIGDLCAKNYNV